MILGCVDKVAQPQADRCKTDETLEGLGKLIVSGRKASGVLQAIKAPFDAIAECIDRAVDFDLDAPVFLRWNDRRSASQFNVCPNIICIIAPVCEQHLRVWRILTHQRIVAFDVMSFSRCEDGPYGEPLRVRAEMDLGRKATARTAKSVSLNPPLPPDAW